MTDSNPTPPVDPVPPPVTPPVEPVNYATPGIAGAQSGIFAPPPPYNGPVPDKDAKLFGMLAHLLTIFSGFVGPLIIWLVKKDTVPFVDDQGKESLNFQLTCLIGYVIAGATTMICIGFIILPCIAIFHLVFAIMAALKANEGIAYRYPASIRFIK